MDKYIDILQIIKLKVYKIQNQMGVSLLLWATFFFHVGPGAQSVID